MGNAFGYKSSWAAVVTVNNVISPWGAANPKYSPYGSFQCRYSPDEPAKRKLVRILSDFAESMEAA